MKDKVAKILKHKCNVFINRWAPFIDSDTEFLVWWGIDENFYINSSLELSQRTLIRGVNFIYVEKYWKEFFSYPWHPFLPGVLKLFIWRYRSMSVLFSGVAYVIPWPLFVNQECYIPKCLSRRAVFENSSCEFFRSLFKAKGQRSTLKNKGDKFIIHDLW